MLSSLLRVVRGRAKTGTTLLCENLFKNLEVPPYKYFHICSYFTPCKVDKKIFCDILVLGFRGKCHFYRKPVIK